MNASRRRARLSGLSLGVTTLAGLGCATRPAAAPPAIGFAATRWSVTTASGESLSLPATIATTPGKPESGKPDGVLRLKPIRVDGPVRWLRVREIRQVDGAPREVASALHRLAPGDGEYAISRPKLPSTLAIEWTDDIVTLRAPALELGKPSASLPRGNYRRGADDRPTLNLRDADGNVTLDCALTRHAPDKNWLGRVVAEHWTRDEVRVELLADSLSSEARRSLRWEGDARPERDNRAARIPSQWIASRQPRRETPRPRPVLRPTTARVSYTKNGESRSVSLTIRWHYPYENAAELSREYGVPTPERGEVIIRSEGDRASLNCNVVGEFIPNRNPPAHLLESQPSDQTISMDPMYFWKKQYPNRPIREAEDSLYRIRMFPHDNVATWLCDTYGRTGYQGKTTAVTRVFGGYGMQLTPVPFFELPRH